MPSSPTPLLGVEQQAAGENLNVWGDPNLNQALQRLTEAIAATTSVSTYPITLTSTNYVANQARNMILACTGAGGTITIPGQSKLYIVANRSSGNVTLTAGGVTAVVPASDTRLVICDGTDCYIGKQNDFQNAIIKNLANGVSAQDAATKAQVDAALAAAQAYTDATAFASASLPGQAGNAGKFLTTNGTATAWAEVYPSFSGTTDYILSSTGSAAVWSTPAQIRTKLSLGGAALLNVGTAAGTVAAGDDSRIVGAAQLSGAVFVGAVSGPAATFTSITGALTGNASTASTWATARTLSFTGDVTGSGSVNGSANVATALTLANSGVSAATYASPSSVTVDAKGRVTAIASGPRVFAWAKATGTTVNAGSNVASISNPGTGEYDVVFTTPYGSADYAIMAMPKNSTFMVARVTAQSSTGFSLIFGNNVGGITPDNFYFEVIG